MILMYFVSQHGWNYHISRHWGDRSELCVYIIHQRSKIPKLSFDGYFKKEQAFLTSHMSSKITTYYVRIENVNPKSEGEILSCAGSLTVNETAWISDGRDHNFVMEAWLKLFDIDSKNNTIRR